MGERAKVRGSAMSDMGEGASGPRTAPPRHRGPRLEHLGLGAVHGYSRHYRGKSAVGRGASLPRVPAAGANEYREGFYFFFWDGHRVPPSPVGGLTERLSID